MCFLLTVASPQVTDLTALLLEEQNNPLLMGGSLMGSLSTGVAAPHGLQTSSVGFLSTCKLTVKRAEVKEGAEQFLCCRALALLAQGSVSLHVVHQSLLPQPGGLSLDTSELQPVN